MELLVTILLLEIALLGLANLFIKSSQSCFLLERSLQALELLRAEMEKLEGTDFGQLRSQTGIKLQSGVLFSLQVENRDPDQDQIIEYKILTGQVIWFNLLGQGSSYTLVTYRHG